jgi:hypothetical protein
LLLLPDKLSDEDIARTLRQNQLDYPGANYLRQLRAQLRPPTPFHPTIESDVASYRYLVQQRVQRLFFRDRHVDMALRLLQQSRGKELIEALILATEPLAIILPRLRRFGFEVTPKAIEYYEHFFFNISLVDQTEMRALMTVRVEDMQLEGDDKEAQIRYKAMKQSMYTDPRYIIVNSGTPGIAMMRLQMRHGLMPSRVDYGRMAETARTLGVMATVECALRQGPKDAQNARDYSTVAVNMDALLRQRGDGDDTLRKTLLTLATVDEPTLNVMQLTGGNYTDSIDIAAEEKDHADK